MTASKRALSCILLAASLACSWQAYALVMGMTTADVKVRSAPNGEQVDSLEASTPVGVLNVLAGWAKVIYLSPPGSQNTKVGWVSLSYLRIISGAAGDDCETEYKTNAKVCVEVSDASLDCRKDYSGEYYRSCEVTVEYEVTTDYSGGSYLDADIECQADIRYSGRGTYSWRSDTSTQDEDHSLYSHGSDSESLTFDFPFSSFNEVTQVKIDSVACEVDSVTLW